MVLSNRRSSTLHGIHSDTFIELLYVISSSLSLSLGFSGIDEINNGTISLEDNMRIDYHRSHLSCVQSAIM